MRLCKILMLCLGGAAVLLSAGRAPVAAGGKDKPAAQAELIVAEADLGEFGLAAMKFAGGVQNGVRAIRFAAPKPVAAGDKGRFAEVWPAGKVKGTFPVTDLQPLYAQASGLERTLPTLYFQK